MGLDQVKRRQRHFDRFGFLAHNVIVRGVTQPRGYRLVAGNELSACMCITHHPLQLISSHLGIRPNPIRLPIIRACWYWSSGYRMIYKLYTTIRWQPSALDG